MGGQAGRQSSAFFVIYERTELTRSRQLFVYTKYTTTFPSRASTCLEHIPTTIWRSSMYEYERGIKQLSEYGSARIHVSILRSTYVRMRAWPKSEMRCASKSLRERFFVATYFYRHNYLARTL